jgi:SAM-dependent methyltransferase
MEAVQRDHAAGADDDIRLQVSLEYGKAITSLLGGGSGGCGCGTAAGCCSGGGQEDTIAGLAGYAGEDRARHESAAKSSFGCGNPLALAGIRPGQTILDLGSGAGFDLLLASDLTGPSGKVIGVDMTDEMLSAARANIERSGARNIELRKGYIEHLPVEDASVDFIISNCVVNLSPDKRAVFREMFRVLKPGGRISVSDIVAQNLPPAVLENARAYAACVAGAVSEDSYVVGLLNAGFTDVEARERLIYTVEQMKGLLGGAFDGIAALMDHDTILKAIEGNVWSARFGAVKPL